MNKNYLFSITIGAIMLVSCQPKVNTEASSNLTAVDSQSYAELDKAKITHLKWDVDVDFDDKIIKGSASFDFENNNANVIYFDLDKIVVDSVLLADNTKAVYEIGERDKVKGEALKIEITPTDSNVTIYYKTSPDASALQWLTPEQTYDKKYPFLLSQGQAILTRSFIPIQDSPSVRITYDATVRVPKELMAVMSAVNPKEKVDDGVYTFTMPQALPPYLIAIAVGNLEYQAIDHRTGVYAEPGQLKSAAWELADMGKMVNIAEELYGEYPWGQYDVLVLPPSFPFGGMENPRLTFATPTIIVGDRSLVTLVAHELAHSWSGNLVTNATWDDFWLNEGFTVYFERRIMEALEGKDYADMLSVIGYQDLQTSMDLIPANFTSLYIDLKGKNPDDAFSDVPYDKGYLFLKMLEDRYGREKFDTFLKKYFKDHKFQTMTTNKFIAYLKDNLTGGEEDFVQNWIYDEGWPKDIVKPQSVLLDAVDKQFQIDMEIVTNPNGMLSKQVRDWSTHEWVHYIRSIDTSVVNAEMMENIDKLYDFTNSHNPEIQCAWYEKAFLSHYNKVNAAAEDFLIHVGRRKFIEPLYFALKESNQLSLAQEIYKKARPNYHFLAREVLDKYLGYSG